MQNRLKIAAFGAATALILTCTLSANAQEVTGGATTSAKVMATGPNVSQAALDNGAN